MNMSSLRIPLGCKSRPGIEQVLKYPVETRTFEQSVKEYFNLLRMEKELSTRDPNMYSYLVERRELRKQTDPIQDSEGYPDSKLYKLLNDSYLKYRMQIQHRAIDEFSFLQDVKDHYIKLTKGPEIVTNVKNIPDASITPRKPEYFSPRSKDLQRTQSTKDTPNAPIRINGVIYYPQPMHEESNSRMSVQSELITRLQAEVDDCNKVIDDLRDRLSKSASREIKYGGPNVLYVDKNTPSKLADDFHSIFTVEWSDALKSLTYNSILPNSQAEQDGIALLMTIVQNGYEFCANHANAQLQKLSFSVERGLEDPFAKILDLRTTQYDQRKFVPDSLMREVKRLRRSDPSHTIMKAIQEFKDGDLLRNPKYNYRHSPAIEGYVNSVIEVLWLMAIQDPSMAICWPQPNDRFNEAIYKPYSKQGTIVKMPVWPAVFLHAKGPLIKQGYVQPV